LIWQPARKALAGSTAGAKLECQAANSVHPPSRAEAMSGVSSLSVAPGGFSSSTCLPAFIAAAACAWRCTEGNGIDLRRGIEEFVERRKMRDAPDGGIAAGDGGHFDARGVDNCGHVLVLGNFAETNDGEAG
jgi:hypothetical protein